MALIKCPECNKEISDKVKSCPHCGYPFDEAFSNNKPQPVEITSINLNRKKSKKILKFILIVVIVAGLVGIYKYFYNQKQRTSYIENINQATSKMIMSISEAEELSRLAAKVWRNTIFKESNWETYRYTNDEKGRFISDFNESIRNLYNDDEIKIKVQSLGKDEFLISEIMKELKNPTREFEKCYETLSELYGSYQGLVDLAISPKGSLQSYSQNISEKTDKFMECYNKLNTQIPEK